MPAALPVALGVRVCAAIDIDIWNIDIWGIDIWGVDVERWDVDVHVSVTVVVVHHDEEDHNDRNDRHHGENDCQEPVVSSGVSVADYCAFDYFSVGHGGFLRLGSYFDG